MHFTTVLGKHSSQAAIRGQTRPLYRDEGPIEENDSHSQGVETRSFDFAELTNTHQTMPGSQYRPSICSRSRSVSQNCSRKQANAERPNFCNKGTQCKLSDAPSGFAATSPNQHPVYSTIEKVSHNPSILSKGEKLDSSYAPKSDVWNDSVYLPNNISDVSPPVLFKFQNPRAFPKCENKQGLENVADFTF